MQGGKWAVFRRGICFSSRLGSVLQQYLCFEAAFSTAWQGEKWLFFPYTSCDKVGMWSFMAKFGNWLHHCILKDKLFFSLQVHLQSLLQRSRQPLVKVVAFVIFITHDFLKNIANNLLFKISVNLSTLHYPHTILVRQCDYLHLFTVLWSVEKGS